MYIKILFIYPALLFLSVCINAQNTLVETENFSHKGGWVIDQQFMDQMGSPFLLAHGLGKPVEDAFTSLRIKKGKYRVWVRTRDWVATWNVPGAPGRFRVFINNTALDTIFGTRNAEWFWHDGGIINNPGDTMQIRLKDLTGFEGRCDAIYFSENLNSPPPADLSKQIKWRRKLLGTHRAEPKGHFDFVVTGGGMAGISAALTASRLGLKVALIQDRPVLGGNSSSEVRVWPEGALNAEPFVNLGKIVKEIAPKNKKRGNADLSAESYEDSTKLNAVLKEKNITLFLNYRANEVITENSRIRKIVAQNIETSERIVIEGSFFADCTGDGVIGFLAGADYQLSENIMGSSNLWAVADAGHPVSFPRCPWALDLSSKPFPGRKGEVGAYNTKGIKALGEWYWESGFSKNPFTEMENIRDWNFRAMFGAWDCLKNVDSVYSTFDLRWGAYISGKRESRRLTGDFILTREDLLNKNEQPDGFIATGWKMDVHIPNSKYDKGFEGNAFISHDVQEKYPIPYHIPYRCLYSKNIGNLFMAGRNISVTHEALGTIRVMKTTGTMGEVIGMAAFICNEKNTTPRGVYTLYLEELKNLARKGIK